MRVAIALIADSVGDFVCLRGDAGFHRPQHDAQDVIEEGRGAVLHFIRRLPVASGVQRPGDP